GACWCVAGTVRGIRLHGMLHGHILSSVGGSAIVAAARSRLAFAPSGGTGCHQFQGGAGHGIRGCAVDMSDLALYVSNWTDLPVVDQTGLRELYTIQTEGWALLADDSSRPVFSQPSTSSTWN